MASYRTARFGLLCLTAVLATGGSAQPAESLPALFAEANDRYQKGDFASAERIYRRLMDAGADSGVLYYNLGNACFKQKRLGEAIYFWEKARQKLPRDRDVQENLALANLMIVDRIEVATDPLPVRLLDDAVHLLTAEQESWIILVLFAAANGLLAMHFLVRNSRASFAGLAGGLSAVFLLLLSGSSLCWKIYEKKHLREGIVVEQMAEIRSGPGTENMTVFTVHEGSKVRIRGEASGWIQVSLPNGWTGWLGKNSLRVL